MKLDFIAWTKKHSEGLANAAGILVALVIMAWLIDPSPVDYFLSTGGKEAHHFQWVGVSTIIAVIGFVYNQAWERKKFDADLKAKSRLDWMKTVRDLLGEYLSVAPASVNKVANYYIWAFTKGVEVNSTDAAFERREEQNELIAKANSLYLTMTLYIPNHAGDDNQPINQALADMAEQVQSSQKGN